MGNGEASRPVTIKEQLQRLGEKKIREAEVFYYDDRLRHFHRLKPSLEYACVDPETTYKRLLEKRDRALKEISSESPPAAYQPSKAPTVLHDAFEQLEIAPSSFSPSAGLTFGYAGEVQLPRASDGINVVPDPAITGGSLVTDFLRPFGGIQFNGQINGVESLPVEELDPSVTNTWLRNWNYFVPFPPPPAGSILTYWFDVFVQVNVFRDSGAARFLSFASLGENPDFSPSNPTVEVNIDAGWPINADLEEPSFSDGSWYNGRYGHLNGRASIRRSFTVGRGKTPVIALTVGAIGMLGQMGRCTFFFGGSGGPSFILPRDTAAAEGRIRFHYAPLPVIASRSS